MTNMSYLVEVERAARNLKYEAGLLKMAILANEPRAAILVQVDKLQVAITATLDALDRAR